MHELQDAFAELIASPQQQALLQQARSVESLLTQLRRLWCLPAWNDTQLMQALEQVNQAAAVPAAALVAGGWLPHRYEARTRSIQWCLPDGPATEPFHDEYIGRCLQRQPLNQFLRPRTPLATLARLGTDLGPKRPVRRPAGFIFHLSRCGSTLVSGCLSELDSTMVLSEPPVLTELLLDPTLRAEEKRQAISGLLAVIGTTVPGRQDLVIKWNAWDLLQWELLRDLYPQAPCLLLVRDPVEILASHHRQCGRHMSGDPSLARLAPVFDLQSDRQPFVSVLDHRIRVLQTLMQRMRELHDGHGLPVLDYGRLGPETLERIAHGFGLASSNAALARMAARLRQHAKALDQRFVPDGCSKAAVFDARDRHLIESRLAEPYAHLLRRAGSFDSLEVLHAT